MDKAIIGSTHSELGKGRPKKANNKLKLWARVNTTDCANKSFQLLLKRNRLTINSTWSEPNGNTCSNPSNIYSLISSTVQK